jgi:protein involved in polysaccharide export with SLBB domain
MFKLEIVFILCIIFSSTAVLAQQWEEMDPLLQDLLKERETPPEILKIKDVPLEGPVDRDSYVIGPGDILTIGVWGEEEKILQVPVTPEGKIVVESVGVIAVTGLSIRDAEAEVVNTLKNFYTTANITLTLTSIRSIKVFLSGQLKLQGSLVVTPVDRISDAITLAGGIREGGSRRSVILNRSSGTERSLDLVDFYVYGNLDENPFLMDGDRIHVPPCRGYVRVRGEVNGLKEVELDRRTLQEGQLPFPKEGLLVEYREGDFLSDMIEMAGGLAETADLARIVIRRQNVSHGDSIMTVDLRDLFFRGDLSTDLEMQSGDMIEIPVLRDYVYVIGAVMTPGSFPYESNFTAQDYVGLAGGQTTGGSDSGWKALNADGKKRSLDRDDYVLPGETIIVSERFLVVLGRFLSPMMAVSTIAIAIAAITK